MIACCRLCGRRRYLDEDGNVLRDELVEAILDDLVSRTPQPGPLTARGARKKYESLVAVLRAEGRPDAEQVADKLILSGKLCRCECHQLGSSIIH